MDSRNFPKLFEIDFVTCIIRSLLLFVNGFSFDLTQGHSGTYLFCASLCTYGDVSLVCISMYIRGRSIYVHIIVPKCYVPECYVPEHQEKKTLPDGRAWQDYRILNLAFRSSTETSISLFSMTYFIISSYRPNSLASTVNDTSLLSPVSR